MGLERLKWFVPQLRERYIQAVGPKNLQARPALVFAPEDDQQGRAGGRGPEPAGAAEAALHPEQRTRGPDRPDAALGPGPAVLAVPGPDDHPGPAPTITLPGASSRVGDGDLQLLADRLRRRGRGHGLGAAAHARSAMASASSEIDPVRQVSALSQGLTAVFIAAFVGMSVVRSCWWPSSPAAWCATALHRRQRGGGAASRRSCPAATSARSPLVNRGLMFSGRGGRRQDDGLGLHRRLLRAAGVPDVPDRLTKAAR